MAILYFLMGLLFAYLAYTSVQDTIWNATTILLAAVAALGFGVGYRYLRMHLKKE
ncbi:YdiK family protein [Pseudogracilibacillus sp. SO30301A]|uniref:YdiK family protein n=1 Tax=Pseudogracilibacillus sp. SO30301A TaxID=3098291 RepID=UPI00300DF521